MELRGHCHFAQVFFRFETLGDIGFPSFEHTHAEIRGELLRLTEKPFRNCTNEDVLSRIFAFFSGFDFPETKKYHCSFRLAATELHVRGVPDSIGHADAFTVYKIEI